MIVAGWTWDEFTLVAGFADGGLWLVGMLAAFVLGAWCGFLVAALMAARQRGGTLDFTGALGYAADDARDELGRRRIGT